MAILSINFNLTTIFQKDFLFILPEIYFGFLLLGFILWVSWLKYIGRIIRKLIIQKFIILLFFYLISIFLVNDFNIVKSIFSSTFLIDYYSILFKVSIILTTICILIFTSYRSNNSYLDNDWLGYIILLGLSLFFMVLLTAVFDLLSFYVVLEGLSLCLYGIATLFIRHLRKGSELAMKYFVMGLLSTGFFLFGIYLIYAETQATSFFKIKEFFILPEEKLTLLSYIGLTCILFGFFFKLGAVPCHIWVADIYEGVPTPITAFFSITVKLAIFSIFIRILFFTFLDVFYFWQFILICVSFLSMLYGFLNAIGTDSLKRLLAFGSINQVGYIFMGLSCGTFEGVQSSLIYLFIYIIMLLILFGLLLNTQITSFNGTISSISDLCCLYKNNPLAAWAYFCVLLSMGGIPPFAGFLGKYYLFLATIHAELYLLAFFGLFISALSMLIYLKIIKTAIFEVLTVYKTVYFKIDEILPILIINLGLFYIMGWLPLTWVLELLVIFNFLEINIMWTSFIFDITNEIVFGLINPLI